jgi:hypothetical protein
MESVSRVAMPLVMILSCNRRSSGNSGRHGRYRNRWTKDDTASKGPYTDAQRNIDMSAGTGPPAGDPPDPADAERLFTALYDELRRLARRELARRGSNITLGATTPSMRRI